jgi:hypothetical protein
MDEEEIKRRIIFGNDVGYGRPPEQNRFKKGQSGNPKGRPKKTPLDLSLTDQPMLSAVLAIANKTVPVRDGGELREMSMLEAVVAATATGAVSVNPRSQATFLSLTQKAYEADLLQRRRSIELWTEYKRAWSAKIADAKKRGEPAPCILPHPDDIIIDHAKGPRFLGPFDKNEETKLNETILFRDTLIMQDELDRRSKVRLNGEPLTEPGSAALLSFLLERGIPPRLQLSDTERVLKMMKIESMQKRELLKLLFSAWQRLGSPQPRGFVSPNLTYTKRYLCVLFDLIQSIHDGAIDPINMEQEELAQIIHDRAKVNGIARQEILRG